MEIETLYISHNGPCPYLPNLEWSTFCFRVKSITDNEYHEMMDLGFRRAGNIHYIPKCKFCDECISLRVLVNQFAMSKSQRKIWSKNHDLQVRIIEPEFTVDKLDLYNFYVATKHKDTYSFAIDEREYRSIFLNFPKFTYEIDYYWGNQLIGVGFVEQVQDLLSSTYFFYDVRYKNRSLGIFSILYEIKLCNQLGLEYLYLGYYVEGCPYMEYKQDFLPNQLLKDYTHWADFKKVIA